jgi:hypothetical protein
MITAILALLFLEITTQSLEEILEDEVRKAVGQSLALHCDGGSEPGDSKADDDSQWRYERKCRLPRKEQLVVRRAGLG